MIIVLSPAKTLKRLEIPFLKEIKKEFCVPAFFNKSLELVKILKQLNIKEIEKLLQVSNSIARLNYERYQNFPEQLEFDSSYPAIFLFYGDVYKGFGINSYTVEHIYFLQKHVRILSGLYGILKPLDLIYPYRLEMGTELNKNKLFKWNSLYEFWDGIITLSIEKELQNSKYKYLINLASNEYFSVIKKEMLSYPVVHIHFQEKRNGKYQTIAINSKRLRGIMTNWIVLNKIENPEDIKNFNLDNYKFINEKSNSNNWFFLKN